MLFPSTITYVTAACPSIDTHAPSPLFRLPSKCKFFFFGIKVSVVMTLNKIGSDFKKLNFYWLFAKSEITFFPLSLSRSVSRSVSLACWHVLHFAHAIYYSKFLPLQCLPPSHPRNVVHHHNSKRCAVQVQAAARMRNVFDALQCSLRNGI